MTFSTERTVAIAPDHPSLAGHFPGNPLVPGVVLLEAVVQALAEWRGDCRLSGVPSVKFNAPLKPAQAFIISLRSQDERRVEFECVCQGERLAQGVLEIA
jgi:3-hydroxymyristoyl/3-hydroxydecanoyl-(acyl carrier protein) dehydratase